jgi:hypothetical protein
MPRFLIQSPHTQEECLQALDAFLAQGPDSLARYDFACAAGDHSNHTSYATVEAANESAARALLPQLVSSRAQVIEVGKVTPEQIRSYHGGL